MIEWRVMQLHTRSRQILFELSMETLLWRCSAYARGVAVATPVRRWARGVVGLVDVVVKKPADETPQPGLCQLLIRGENEFINVDRDESNDKYTHLLNILPCHLKVGSGLCIGERPNLGCNPRLKWMIRISMFYINGNRKKEGRKHVKGVIGLWEGSSIRPRKKILTS
jgi:hypothetical protein